MRIDILTLFPDTCEAYLGESIIGRARKANFVEMHCHNIRSYTKDKHNQVDDCPYGGGTGMVMQPIPIYDCFQAVCAEAGTRPHLIYMSAQGKTFTEADAVRLSQYDNIAILCGHYEGVDERVIEEIVDEELSAGDYVLTGGELPALMVADAVTRLLPGVLASEDSYMNESHYSGLLEHPQYTRPAVFLSREVPEVLLNGHHANIEKWRSEQSLTRTFLRRPDMLETAPLNARDRVFIENLRNKKSDK